MAGYMNTVIVGNVGRDAELRSTQSGTPVSDFSVAVTRKWTDKESGKEREKTTWFRVTAWRGLGETCAKYVTKGMQVMVEGEISVSAYMGKDGDPRGSLDITARDVQFLGNKSGNGGNGYQPSDDDDPGFDPESLPF